MSLYECRICNFKTHIKTHLKTHLNTKKHKKNKEKYDIENKNSTEFTQIYTNDEEKSAKFTQNYTKFTQNSTQIYKCEYCDKEFARKDSLKRHMKKSCIEKDIFDKKKEEIKADKLLLQEYKKELEENKKEKEKLYKYIEKLIDKSGGDTIHIGDQQTNQQINLNSFGNEDISHITETFKKKMLHIPYGMVQKFIERVHFSNKKPENKNIAITNKKDKMIKIFKNKKWKYKNKTEIMDELIKINYGRLDDYYENGGKEQLDKFNNNKYMNFQNKFDNQDEDLLEKITNECEMIIMSDNL